MKGINQMKNRQMSIAFLHANNLVEQALKLDSAQSYQQFINETKNCEINTGIPFSTKTTHFTEYKISDYVQVDIINTLEKIVCSELITPLDFKIRIFGKPKVNEEIPELQYFMSYFKIFLEPDEKPFKDVLLIIAERYEIIDSFENEFCIECIAHDGPYAETKEHILNNIDAQGPAILKAFNEMGLNVKRLQFLLDECH